MEETFSVRIVSIDSFASKPVEGLDANYSEFRRAQIKQVPVIRVFGSTPAGQSVCLYIHGVFPYLLLPYHGPLEDFETSTVKQYLQQVAVSLDQALNSASGFTKSSQQHVYKIVLLRGRPFYGFHENDEIFMKVYLYNQSDVKRSSELLQAGAIMNQSYQPYEAHIPFILQFSLDYNLYGMNLLHTKCSWFRKPLGKPSIPKSLPIKSGFGKQTSNKQHQDIDDDDDAKQKQAKSLPNLSQLNNFNWNKLRTRNLNDSDISRAENQATTFINNSTDDCDVGVHSNNGTQNSDCQQSCRSFISQLNISCKTKCPFHTIWSKTNVPSGAFLTSINTDRSSTCDLEVDILASDILNRNEIKESIGKNPGIESIWADEKARRHERGESSQFEVPATQGPRPINIIWKKEAQYLKELQDAVIAYYAQSQDCTQTSVHENDSASLPGTKTSLNVICQSSDKVASDSLITGAEESMSPIVEDAIVSQVVSQSSLDKIDKGLNSSLTFTLKDMDTVMHPDSQQSDTITFDKVCSNYNSNAVNNDDGAIAELWDYNNVENRKNQKSLFEHDLNESYLMSQAWEHGIENLIGTDELEVDIPQLDGTSDKELDLRNDEKLMVSGERSRQADSTSTSDTSLVTEVSSNGQTPCKESEKLLDSQKKTGTVTNVQSKQRFDPGLSKEKQSSIARAICRKFQQQSLKPDESPNIPETVVPKIDENSNMFSTFQALMDDASLAKFDLQSNTIDCGKKEDYAGKGSSESLDDEIVMGKTVVDLSKTSPQVVATKLQNYPTKRDDSAVILAPKHLSDVAGALVTISSDPGVVIATWCNPTKPDETSTDKETSVSSTLRPRRLRQTSSYVNQSFFETEFENDWEDFVHPATQQKTKRKKCVPPKRTNRRTCKGSKTAKKSKERVIIKWIITNRFKGVQNMGVKLWKIPAQKRVFLSEKLLAIYDLYSPKKRPECNGPIFESKQNDQCIKPPKIPSPTQVKIPKGRRTKANVVTQFHSLHELAPTSSPVVGAKKVEGTKCVDIAADKPRQESQSKALLKPTTQRNLFTDALIMHEETLEVVEQTAVKNKSSGVVGECHSQKNVKASQSSQGVQEVVCTSNQCVKPLVSMEKQHMSGAGKLKRLLAKKKHVSKKYRSLIGKNSSKNKFSSEILKRALKKSSKRKLEKFKSRHTKKSWMLPVTSRTVTPVNQHTVVEDKEEETVSSKTLPANSNAVPTKQKPEIKNIFTRISPFIASETVAMLKTIPEITSNVHHLVDNEKKVESRQQDNVSELSEAKNKMVTQLTDAQLKTADTEKYLPTRRVTRHSVAARMKSLTTPEWMFDSASDASCDKELQNVLDMLGRQSPLQKQQMSCVSPPRPWSPMLSPKVDDVPDEEALENIQPDAELGIDAETVLSSIEGMDEIIRDVKLSTSQDDDGSNLLSHLDALLNSEAFASESSVEAPLGESFPSSDDLKTTPKGIVSFMDILLENKADQPNPQPLVSTSKGDSYKIVNENIPMNPPSGLHLKSNNCSETTDVTAFKEISTKITTPLSAGGAGAPVVFQMNPTLTSNLSLISNTRAIPNKQTLQEQLHKQMQAVYLQQQMLDNNNFRTEGICFQNTAHAKKKLPTTSKENLHKSFDLNTSSKAPKDVLDEVCQHVFSDTTVESSASDHFSSFNILNSEEVLENKNRITFSNTSPSNNTFLYPCQGFVHTNGLRGKSFDVQSNQQPSPILHVPVPQANPLQVVHTHVHHHHHIHSIKDSNMPKNQTQEKSFLQINSAKVPKSEKAVDDKWPTKLEPTTFLKSASAGVDKSPGRDLLKKHSISNALSLKRPFSIMMKPTCQNGDEKYWLQVQMQHGIPWYGKPSTNKSMNLSSDQELYSNKAKTPYGAMKLKDCKNMLSSRENHLKFPASGCLNHLKRKAPTNTPTICLNQSLKPCLGKELETDKFELSQDMFGSTNDPMIKKSTKEKQPNLFKPPQAKKRSQLKKKRTDLKPTKLKAHNPVTGKVGKSVDGSRYCSRFTTVPLVTSQMRKLSQGQCTAKAAPPAISDKQQLILNYETGQWDVVEKDSFETDRDVPVLLKPEEQTLGNFVSIAEMDELEQNSELCEEKLRKENSKCFSALPVEPHTLFVPKHGHSVSAVEETAVNHEYTVETTHTHSTSLKLKLTLKKKSNSKTPGSDCQPTHSVVHGRGKPTSYTTIVKQSCIKSLKKSEPKKSKKRKLAKLYVLDTSVSSTFIELNNPLDFYSLSECSASCDNQRLPFCQRAHLQMVEKFCLLRSSPALNSSNIPPHVITANQAEVALSALDSNSSLDILMQAKTIITGKTAKGIVCLPITGSDKAAAAGVLLSQKEKTCKTDIKHGSQNTANECSSIMQQHTMFDEQHHQVNKHHKEDAVFVATPAPPMKDAVVPSFVAYTNEESDDPFYSDAADVQSTSTRLFVTLPAYVKIPKLKSPVSELQEFETKCTAGLGHWRMVLGEKALSDNRPVLDCALPRAQKLLNQYQLKDVELHDTIDVICNITKYPFLKQALLKDDAITVVSPATKPPTYADVLNWLKNMPKIRLGKTSNSSDVSSLPDNKSSCTSKGTQSLDSSSNISSTPPRPQILGQNHILKPRKVSFDLCEKYNEDSSFIIEEYQSMEEDSIPPNQVGNQTSSVEDEDDSLILKVSSDSESMLSLSSPENNKSKSSSTSAIATLVGSSKDNEEEIQLTPLLSGQFVSQVKPSSSLGSKTHLSSQLQSTPNSQLTSCKIKRQHLHYTPITGQTDADISLGMLKQSAKACNKHVPPTRQDSALKTMPSLHTPNRTSPYNSEIVGATLDNSYGFRASQLDLGEAKALHERQHITVVSMELHARTRLDLNPDPEMDAVMAIFYAIHRDSGAETKSGAFIVEPAATETDKRLALTRCGVTNLPVSYVSDEIELFSAFADMIVRLDPDILVGYEVQMLSWGYLLDRAEHLHIDMCRGLSRVPGDESHNRHTADADVFGADNASEIHIVGRVVLNLWRLMRSEVALCDYSFESVTFHLLHERHPCYSHRTLNTWFGSPVVLGKMQRGVANARHRVVDYYMCRVLGSLKLISQQDLIGRTSELARLFGIQFYEVLTRGSQFRVESMMLRLAHSLNYVAVSPTSTQRAGMKAPECIPLVMEPESRFYSEPVIVLDFQSLYPSVVIAHNYCFSTCLGRVQHLGKQGNFTFGCSSLNVPPRVFHKLLHSDGLTVAPNGVAYVKRGVRRGVLPTMLDEILNTRIMVKNSMKQCTDSATKRLLDHRQLGLKLIANVTYGYTSASFSGRMPCVEIADSIVHKARETLERAIELVHANHEKWGARVVYGDTDSMFVALPPGTSKKRAFQIGREIVHDVTYDNPPPMKLKLEKVYQPCILQTKKRYVGYAYESEEQIEPIFDAKGIETVRRDGCPAVAKILEKSLRILFESRDVSQVKQFVQEQWSKILDGRSTLQDCTIAKEYRGAKYYRPGAIVPALVLARKKLAEDKRSEPRIGERVPYVIVHGVPGTPLFRLVRQPHELLLNPTLRLHGTYYVTKMVLPALDRVMALVGVDVQQWYRDLPRAHRITAVAKTVKDDTKTEDPNALRKNTISQYFESRHCVSCKGLSQQAICCACLREERRPVTALALLSESRRLERKHYRLALVCQNCSSATSPNDIKCQSLSCPIIYKYCRSKHELNKTSNLRDALSNHDMF